MNRWNRRIALAAVLAAFSAPALAADPAQDCTVCRDPLWPVHDSFMPGIALNAPAAAGVGDASAISGDATWIVASNRSPGVGVSANAGTRGTSYADPLWPTTGTRASGIAASEPGSPAPAPRAAPAAKVQVASR
jgi:hypothetical protein